MSDFVEGVRVYFVALLAVSSVSKMWDLRGFELALIRLFGIGCFTARILTSKSAAFGLVFYEGALAVAIAAGALDPFGGVVLIATMAIFTLVVARALYLHISCGCFRNRRPAELGSLVRSCALLLLSIVIAIADLMGSGGNVNWLFAGGYALGVAAIVAGFSLLIRALAGQPRPIEQSNPAVLLSALPAEIGSRVSVGRLARSGREGAWVDALELSRDLSVPLSSVLKAAAEGSRR